MIMNTEQQHEINEVMKKHLPAQVGELLRERLAQAELDANEIINLRKRIAEVETINKAQTEAALKLADMIIAQDTLFMREEALEDQQRKLDIDKLTYELQCEKDKTNFAQGIAMGLVRNTNYRKNIMDSHNPGGMPIVDGNGITHYPMRTDKAYTETQSED